MSDNRQRGLLPHQKPLGNYLFFFPEHPPPTNYQKSSFGKTGQKLDKKWTKMSSFGKTGPKLDKNWTKLSSFVKTGPKLDKNWTTWKSPSIQLTEILGGGSKILMVALRYGVLMHMHECCAHSSSCLISHDLLSMSTFWMPLLSSHSLILL